MIQETDEITYAWNRSRLARVPPGELILVTDFDGTLAEIVQDPAAAGARPEALDALQELVPLLADVIVLSSRPPAQLERLVPVSGVRLIGDSGLAIPRKAQKEALDRFNADASRLLEPIPGSWLEVKPASTAIHFRNTDKTGEQMLALLRSLLDGARLGAALGRKVIEVHAPKAGKGSALAALLPGEDPGGVVCFGDDENDRSMFEYISTLEIPHMCVGVWSPEAPVDLFDRCDVDRVDRKHVFSQLLMRTGILRQHDQAALLVQQRAFLGDQVETVVDRVDEKHVKILQRRDRLALALSDLEPDRLPVRRAQLDVDPRGGLLDLSQVANISRHVLARRLEESPELDLSAELGMVAQHLLVRDESTNDILGRVGAVDARDQVGRSPRRDVLFLAVDATRRGEPHDRADVDRNRVVTRVDDPAARDHSPLVLVDLQAEVLLARQQEIANVEA